MKLSFYKPRPSTHVFRNAKEVSEFAADQAARWQEFLSSRRQPAYDNFRFMWASEDWHRFAGISSRPAYEDRSQLSALQIEADKLGLVVFDGEVGLALREIGERFGSLVLAGALRGAHASFQAVDSRSMDTAQLLGLSLVADALSISGDKSPKQAGKTFQAVMTDLETAASKHRAALAGIEESLSERLILLKEQQTRQEADYERWRSAARDQASEQFNEWEDEWIALRKTFVEELRIKAPVVFWNERAEAHRRRAASLLGQAFLYGACGFGIVVATSVGAVIWIAKAEAFKAQPTIQLFAMIASVALISSLYLWLMRVLVRFYISEVHLGTDAEGRSAITTTYLALLKDDAVKSEDRAVVLAALVRPPQDGMIKDDGMPTITAAGLLSGMMGGKPGPGT